MGGVANTFKKVADPLKIFPKRDLGTSKGVYESFADPMGFFLKDTLDKGPGAPPADPLDFNFEQATKDKSDIEAEGERQYQQNMTGLKESSAASTQRAKDLFSQMLPDIAENSQAAHLYDSTGYGQEVARQQSDIASQIADQEAQQRLAALGAKQGFQTGAIQRGMSLEDFTNQARVAKAIGATMAPQAPSSKATGTSGALSGAGAGATVGGPWGALIGGAGGYLMGSRANQKGSK